MLEAELQSQLSVNVWKAKCGSQGGVLASISSAEDQKKAEDALKKTKRAKVLVGVHRNAKNLYQFINLDAKPVTFT